ncbi:MAG: hypothetical protein RL172_345, partial [Bacteroidota bacterium]
MIHKNFKNIDKVVFGRGSFNNMAGILAEKRNENEGFFLFVVDNYFAGKDLLKRIPAESNDIVKLIDVDP